MLRLMGMRFLAVLAACASLSACTGSSGGTAAPATSVPLSAAPAPTAASSAAGQMRLGGNIRTPVTVAAVGRIGVAPADGNGLTAGACASPEGVVTFVLGGSPMPRCNYARGSQTVEVVNGLDAVVRVRLGYQLLTLPPGARGRFRGAVAAFLARGHHVLSDSGYKGGGAELVVRG
jgi:hypothetical protein